MLRRLKNLLTFTLRHVRVTFFLTQHTHTLTTTRTDPVTEMSPNTHTRTNDHIETELTHHSLTSWKKAHTHSHAFSWAKKKKESEGSVKPRNAELSPPLQNSWEQQTLSSETLEKGFRATQKMCSLHCSVNGWETFWLAAGFGFPPQWAGIECINTLNNLKYGLIVPEISIPTRRCHRMDGNKWISFEVEGWCSECEDVNIKKTFIPACNDKWFEAPS